MRQEQFPQTGIGWINWKDLLGCFLQIGAFIRHDRAFHRTNLETNTAINANGKVNPIPISAFEVFGAARMDASNRTGIDAIGNTFASIRDNGMRHSVLLSFEFRVLNSAVVRQLKIHHSKLIISLSLADGFDDRFTIGFNPGNFANPALTSVVMNFGGTPSTQL